MNVWSHGCPRFDEKSYPWFIRVFTYTIEVERNVQFTERSGRSTRIAHNVEVKSPSAETWISHFFRSCKLTAFSSKPQPMTCQLGDMKKYGFFRKFMIFIKKPACTMPVKVSLYPFSVIAYVKKGVKFYENDQFSQWKRYLWVSTLCSHTEKTLRKRCRISGTHAEIF